ncbi:MAG: menaquinone via futalosine step 1 [Epsilonproteobacteria bacterium]|nr:menaquinone via futalosine step 1 [Campylobacterota bacterium]
MGFGKIDYINLLPFYTFLKKRGISHRYKQILNYKKDYPSAINKKFKKRRVEAAFISSIESRKFKCLKIGIVAKGEVRSVIVKKGEYKEDLHSATSNALAKILNIKGEVLIGDKALKLYLKDPSSYEDLSKLWFEKTSLPFVFARLCYHKKERFYKNISRAFLKERVKIPQYILKRYSKQRKISQKEILDYLNLIEYKIDRKCEKSLKIFLKKAKKS